MKTLLLTGFDKRMQPIGELTAPLMLSYASKHQMDFLCVRTFPEGKPGYWHKMVCVISAFKDGYEQVIWMDADQVITNPEYVPNFDNGFHASLDWGADVTEDWHFTMAAFCAFPNSLPLFEWVVDHEKEYINGPFPEQTPMRHLYETDRDFRSLMTIHPRQLFGAVPKQVHENVVEPWNRNCWMCHITMLEVPDRVKVFHEIMKEMMTWQ